MSNNNNQEQYNELGDKSTDFIDGVAFTAILLIVVTGVIYFLYTV